LGSGAKKEKRRRKVKENEKEIRVLELYKVIWISEQELNSKSSSL
jgi:hypothetical protein